MGRRKKKNLNTANPPLEVATSLSNDANDKKEDTSPQKENKLILPVNSMIMAENASLRFLYDTLQKENQILREKLNESNKSNENLLTRLTDLNINKIDLVLKENDHLKDAIIKIEDENIKLKEANKILSKENEKLKELVEILTKKVKNLEDEIHKGNKKVNNLEDEIHKGNKFIDKIRTRQLIEQFKNKVAREEKQIVTNIDFRKINTAFYKLQATDLDLIIKFKKLSNTVAHAPDKAEIALAIFRMQGEEKQAFARIYQATFGEDPLDYDSD